MNINYRKVLSKLCCICILKNVCILIVFFFYKKTNEINRNSFENLTVQLEKNKKISWAENIADMVIDFF